MRHIFYVLFVLALGTLGLNAQTTLGAGDIGIIGFHSDNPDDVALVMLTDVDAGTIIKLTDNGWSTATNAFRANEGTWTLTLTRSLSCGFIIYVDSNGAVDIDNNSMGDITGSNPALASSGDQILVYQGDNNSPSFVTAINFQNSSWQSDATSSNTSALPPGLTDGVNAFALQESDNATYDCSTLSGDPGDLLFDIYKNTAWSSSNTRGNITLASCNFTVTNCGGVIADPCSIDGISTSSISACMGNGTINASDDYATLNVDVMFSNPPATGMLTISGDVNVSMPVGNLSGGMVSIPAMIVADGGAISLTASFTDEPTCALSNTNAGTAPEACSFIPACSYPFISEYIEGSSNNKCIEIYNPTGSTINLSGDYKLMYYFNGNTSPGNTIDLTGSIESGGTFVVCHTSSASQFQALADQTTGGSWFNGDDAIALTALVEGIPDTPIDVFGQIGTDPGSQWSGGGVGAQNRTLRRWSGVLAGDNIGSNPFNPGLEWIEFSTNTEWGLGYHATDCVEGGFPDGWNPFNIGCSDAENSYDAGNDEWILSSNCFNPATGSDDLSYVFQEQCGAVDISAKIESITGLGRAGVMIRTSPAPNSAYVWLFKQGNSFVFATRRVDNAIPTYQVRPFPTASWVRIVRTGFVVRGYLSLNGTSWYPMFQSFVFMPDCLFAGLAVHSNVDGANTTAVFSNVSINGNDGLMTEIVEGAEALSNLDKDGKSADVEFQEIANQVDVSEVKLTPNPVSNWLTVDLPKGLGEEVILNIFDVNGKQVYTENLSLESNHLGLDIAAMNISEGTYFLSLRTATQVITKRFVKVR